MSYETELWLDELLNYQVNLVIIENTLITHISIGVRLYICTSGSSSFGCSHISIVTLV
jgi:hypothetical protein